MRSRFCHVKGLLSSLQRFDGQYALDILYGATDPDLVKGELDTYWIQKGGTDPAAYIRQYSGRCPLIHLKDMAAGEIQSFAEVGEGTLDWPAIFAAGSGQDCEQAVMALALGVQAPLGPQGTVTLGCGELLRRLQPGLILPG